MPIALLLRTVAGALLPILVAASAGGGELGSRWQRLDAPAGVDRAEALAIDAASGRLAVGGERGVAWGPLEGPLERVLARGPVRDLVFAPGGDLLAATDAGLYRVTGPGRVFAEQVGTGEAARAVRDLDAAVGWLAAATDGGVFLAAAAEAPPRWRRIAELPFGEARRVLLNGDAKGGPALWAVVDGALWRADPGEPAVREALPRAAEGEEGPLDLARGAGGELLAVLPRALAIRDAAGAWRVERLVLPPGALPLRVFVEGERLWLATDSGLLTAPGPAGPWLRADPPAGHVAVTALAGAGARLVVATAHGLLRHENMSVVAARPAAPPRPPAPLAPDPPVVEVHRRALRYLSLEPAAMRELWSGAGRSALYPQLSVRGDWGRDRDRGLDYDQAFLAGDTRHLYDRDRSRGEDYSLSVILSWDLGEAAFNADRIDVSREARLVAQLRDDVLDEINQLYFERQRVLASLAAPPPDLSPDDLRRRAAELASGLDAWTGGWFSERIARPDSTGPSLPGQESSP